MHGIQGAQRERSGLFEICHSAHLRRTLVTQVICHPKSSPSIMSGLISTVWVSIWTVVHRVFPQPRILHCVAVEELQNLTQTCILIMMRTL